MLLKSLINKGVETVSDVYPEREAREMVFAFLEHHLGTKRHTHIVEPMYEVADDLAEEALSAFRRMASGEPLQYVTGFADFYGRKFRTTPAVLIPRPETEILCRNVLAEGMGCQGCGDGRGPSEHLATIPSVLDLCTGSGCIAWTLALEMPGADVTAVDISDGALTVASSQDFSEEIARTGARAPEFIKADVLAGPSLAGQYDILVSNPPYVMDKEKTLMRPNVLDHEPHLALFVSDDDPLVFYRAIADWAHAVLKPGGYAIVEINEALGPETAALYETAGFTDVRILKDLSDRDRFVSFRR
jgi:release factor glutamine methyltransferase